MTIEKAPCGCPIIQISSNETRVMHLIQCTDRNVIEQSIRSERERREQHERYVQTDRDETEGS